MLMWSDLATLETPLAAREVVRTAISAHRPRRVLLAGPRAGLLVDAVPTDVRVDVLVRALPDARLLGDRAGLHESSDIYCGGLDVFAPGHTYDLIVALGGPGRLLGPDSQGLTEAETVARLAALLEEGGRLVIDLANEMGFTDLVSALPDETLESDAGWYVGAAGFSPRHVFARERSSILAAQGLDVEATFAALPSVDHHSLLVRDDAVRHERVRDRVGVRAGQAMDEHFSTTPMLREPRTMLQRIVDAGMLDELAPAWVVLATKGASTTEVPAYPTIVSAERETDNPWSTVAVVSEDDTETLSWARPRGDDEISEGKLSRTLVPSHGGRSFELELRQACATRRHAAIRG